MCFLIVEVHRVILFFFFSLILLNKANTSNVFDLNTTKYLLNKVGKNMNEDNLFQILAFVFNFDGVDVES